MIRLLLLLCLISITTDYRGNKWIRAWHECCGRFQGSLDPRKRGTISNTDFYGNVTHTAVVTILPLPPNTDTGVLTYSSHNPHKLNTLNETTTRYDARHRPIATTRWLVPLPRVDAQNPPIAGIDGEALLNGDGDLRGLTTQYLYAENLTDADLTVQELGGSESDTYTISITDLIGKLKADANANADASLGDFFATGSDGSARVTINPEEEISVSIQDGLGRTVATAIIAGPHSTSPNIAITWSTTHYDAMEPVTGFNGKCLETVRYDALDNITKSRTDGAGRTLETETIEVTEEIKKYITTLSYDNNGNRLTVLDPMGVGLTCVFDNRNRDTQCEDTQGDTTQTVYDANNNVVTLIDAKHGITNPTTCTFDARNRRISCNDRIGATTHWRYDQNSNLLSIKDGDNQLTSYRYETRNLRHWTIWPDHEGALNYGVTRQSYDAAGRPSLATDQLRDTCTYKYDMANRLLSKEYRLATNLSSIEDTDTFTYDAASRMLTAISGRYSNTVTLTYDDVGRTAREKLTIAGRKYSLSHAYDDASRPTKLTYPDGTVVDRTYTDRHQLANIKYQSADVATFTYDAGMRETQRTHGNNLITRRLYGRNDNLVTDYCK